MPELTCDEVNLAIYMMCDDNSTPAYWLLTHPKPMLDYCHDWAAAGPLLEEMAAYMPAWSQIRRKLVAVGWQNQPAGFPLTEAIARAWLAWKEQE